MEKKTICLLTRVLIHSIYIYICYLKVEERLEWHRRCFVCTTIRNVSRWILAAV